jgi:hypothetical protein
LLLNHSQSCCHSRVRSNWLSLKAGGPFRRWAWGEGANRASLRVRKFYARRTILVQSSRRRCEVELNPQFVHGPDHTQVLWQRIVQSTSFLMATPGSGHRDWDGTGTMGTGHRA